jgi:hypothetical protein
LAKTALDEGVGGSLKDGRHHSTPVLSPQKVVSANSLSGINLICNSINLICNIRKCLDFV